MNTCMVVDDSRVVRKVARRIVEGLGYDCEEAADGQKAHELCENSMPDVILLDWNMPVMSGIEFLEKLRQMEGGEAVKVIFCTTENDLAHVERAIKAGADEYIMKPFDSEIIQLKFEQVGLTEKSRHRA